MDSPNPALSGQTMMAPMCSLIRHLKGRNICSNPKVALLVIDPKNVNRWIEILGKVVEISRDGAEAHADKLTQLYTGKQRFYGDIYPVEQKRKETRVIVKIEPVKVALDAFFSHRFRNGS
jgi:hypothetical protein